MWEYKSGESGKVKLKVFQWFIFDQLTIHMYKLDMWTRCLYPVHRGKRHCDFPKKNSSSFNVTRAE